MAKLSFIDNIGDAPKLWSVRLAAVAAALGGIEAFLPALEGSVPDGLLGILSTIAAVGAAVARVLKQRNVRA